MRWTQSEDSQLEFLWGAFSLKAISAKLRRTTHAVAMRARKLGLGPASRGTVSMRSLIEKTGYSESRVRFAVDKLGLKLRRSYGSEPKQRTVVQRLAITEEQVEEIIEFLKTLPDGQRLLRDDTKRTPGGKWGVGKKPAACVLCTTSEIPHFARGQCRRCYHQKYKLRRVNPRGVGAGC